MPTTAHALYDATFRTLFGAQVVSLVGTGLSTVALALLAHDMAGGDAGAVLGTVLALKMVSYVFATPLLARVLQRLPDKPVLIALDLVRALIVARLPFVSSLAEIYLLVALLSLAAAGFTPAFRAALPRVLPDEARYTQALSLSRLAYDLEALASPALAALALAFVGYSRLFLLDGLTFVLSALLVAAVTLPPSVARTQAPRRLTHGLRLYLATPRLRGLLALHLSASAAGAMVIVNTVVLVRQRLGLGDTETACALAASGAGSMVVAMLIPRLLRRISDRRLMLLGGGLVSAALVLGAVFPLSMESLLGLWLLIGAGTSAIHTPAGRLVARTGEAGDGPSLFAAEFTLSHAAWLLAYPVAGVAGAQLGLSTTFGILAVLSALGVAAAGWLWPSGE